MACSSRGGELPYAGVAELVRGLVVIFANDADSEMPPAASRLAFGHIVTIQTDLTLECRLVG